MRKDRTPGRIAETVAVVGLAGMIGGVLFPVLSGIVLPATDATVPIPIGDDVAGRYFWALLPAALIGFAAGRQR